MSKDTSAPLEPCLIPDAPESQAEPLVQRLTPVVTMGSKRKTPRAEVTNRQRRPKPKKFTLAEAFDHELSEAVNLEKAVRAVGFLLHFCSDIGNRDVNGWLAEGLGHVLDFTANHFTYAFRAQQDEIAKLRAAVEQLTKKQGG